MKLSELDLNLLAAETDKVEGLYNEINDTASDYPRNKSIVDLFEANVDKYPDKTAVTIEDSSVRYSELDKRANRIAQWLVKNGLQKEDVVAVYLSRSIDLISSILGILKAGGAYLPLNIEYPLEQCKHMVKQSGVKMIIGEKDFIKALNTLQWECESVETVLCINSDNAAQEKEQRNQLMKDLWEYFQDNTDDEIELGGWMSSYTGERMSDEEMQEYGENVLQKLDPYLTPETKVLEIGCSSGLTMYRIAPKVKSYHGTDISQAIVDWNEAKCESEGITNITMQCVAAEDLDQIKDNDYDIIIFNSVIQVLSGFNSLRQLITKSVEKLDNKGLLFFGDIMDLDLKQDLIDSLSAFKRENNHNETKLNFDDELFVPRAFFEAQESETNEIVSVIDSRKIHTISNELTDFRYDVILEIDKDSQLNNTEKANKRLCDKRDLVDCNEERVGIETSPDQLSNVMFTSGSTGTPKGVMIRHRSNIRTVVDSFLGVRPDDIWLQTAEISFDPSCQEIFGALLNGATLCLIPKNTLIDPAKCHDYFHEKGITILQLVTALFHHLGDASPGMFANVRKLVVGGDVLSKRVVDKVKAINDKIEIVNAYGPTENCIISTTYSVEGDSDKIPIGKPISNSGIYILDELGKLLPVGMAGELHVFGDGLAKGYINDEERTKERFVENTISGKGKMYKTGDLARLRPDGNVEFLGRIDNQVKINGNRVELQEIEEVLKDLVGSSHVLVNYIQKEEAQFVCAYVAGELDFDDDSIKRQLSNRVPDHMVPRFFVKLDKLPLTTNGKIDKKALPIPDFKNAEDDSVIAPRNINESQILDIFKKVLKVDSLGVTHNFFKVGGHSLLATQVIAHINQEFDVDLELKTFFSQPTVAELAAIVANLTKEEKDIIPKLSDREYYETSSGQRRLWILEHFDDQKSVYNISDAFLVKGDLQPQELNKAMKEVINRHEVLRTVFTVNENGDPVQKVLSLEDQDFNIESQDYSGIENNIEQVKQLCRQNASAHFDLEKGPLFKVFLYQLAPGECVVFFVIHHIVADGWSIQLLMEELLQFYNANVNNTSPDVPELNVQYKDFASWQNSKLANTGSGDQRKYWMDKFKDDHFTTEFPTDHPRTEKRTSEAKRVLFKIDEDQSAKAIAASEDTGTTLFMYALTVVNMLVHLKTRSEKIVIGTPLAGRTHSDTENLIGLFLNVLPLKNEIATGMTISEFVDSVKNNSLEAFDNQLYPFDMLVDDLKVERNSSRFPLFDVGFTWQNIEVGSQDSAVAGVSVEGFSYDFQHVKTDLWFHGWKSDQELNFSITYNKDLFESKTIEGYVEDFKTLFQTILTNPESQVSKVADEIRKARLVKKESRSKSMKKSRFKKFQDIEVKPISFSKEDLVSIDESSEYPLVIKPNIDDLVLAKWVQENNQLLQERLRSNGAILFRGFNIKNQDHFQEILSALEGESMNYSDQSSPRTLVADKVYTSTDHPSDQVINMHNELSYSHDWPLTISFYCDIPPVENGETPIADTRKVLKMLSPATREKFEEHGVLYMRNLVDGLGLSWQQVYQTDDKSKVEEHCKKKGINFEWFSDEHLRISWKRPAVQTNPITKEKAWFNHGFFFNAANLDQAIHDVIQDEELLPFNTYFGNGDKIDEAVFDELKSAYAQCKVKFKWQKGDLLVLDNMCMAHGRESYSGDRKILVGMNRPHSIVVNGTN